MFFSSQFFDDIISFTFFSCGAFFKMFSLWIKSRFLFCTVKNEWISEQLLRITKAALAMFHADLSSPYTSRILASSTGAGRCSVSVQLSPFRLGSFFLFLKKKKDLDGKCFLIGTGNQLWPPTNVGSHGCPCQNTINSPLHTTMVKSTYIVSLWAKVVERSKILTL